MRESEKERDITLIDSEAPLGQLYLSFRNRLNKGFPFLYSVWFFLSFYFILFYIYIK